MEFTKEEIKTAYELYSIWNKGIGIPDSETFPEFLDSLLKPETKFINVRIEVESDLTANGLRDLLKTFGFLKIHSVKELPEVFTRKDMIEFGEYSKASTNYSCAENFQRFVTFGRKSK